MQLYEEKDGCIILRYYSLFCFLWMKIQSKKHGCIVTAFTSVHFNLTFHSHKFRNQNTIFYIYRKSCVALQINIYLPKFSDFFKKGTFIFSETCFKLCSYRIHVEKPFPLTQSSEVLGPYVGTMG